MGRRFVNDPLILFPPLCPLPNLVLFLAARYSRQIIYYSENRTRITPSILTSIIVTLSFSSLFRLCLGLISTFIIIATAISCGFLICLSAKILLCPLPGGGKGCKAVTYASIAICELLIEFGANISGSSALTIASNNGKADPLVKSLLKTGADPNEMGVASIVDRPEDLKGTALHLIEKERKDILDILLDHGADFNKKDRMGKTVMLRMCENGDEVLWPIVKKNGGHWH